MRKILAIETSSRQGSVALQLGDAVFQKNLPSPREQISQLLPVIDALLLEADTRLAALDVIAISAGPGSFTGLRVAQGVAEGLAFAHNLPIETVSSLQVLAQTAYRCHQFKQVTCVNNAFMNELYVGKYQADDDDLMLPIEADQAIKLEQLATAQQYVGDAGVAYPDLFIEQSCCELFPQAQDMISLVHGGMGSETQNNTHLNYLRDKTAWKR